MPVHVVSEGAGPGPQVPTHLNTIPISSINISTDGSNILVKGKVVRKGPLVSLTADSFILKAVIQEEDSQQSTSSQQSSINVVLMGTLAKDFNQEAKQGDVLVVSGFTVGKSPTVNKDKMHPCNLLLSGDDAYVYVSRLMTPPDPGAKPSIKRSPGLSAQVSRPAKAPKYTYVGLGDLKPGPTVSVYGVVTFFKQPYKSRGTDFCSMMKITDQSKEEILCKIFCKKLEDHPKIFQIGDIVRLHGVKPQTYRNTIELLKTFGFSALTFDGVVGRPVEPRTSSSSFHFDEEDKQRVEELRSWAAGQGLLPTSSSVSLSAVEPNLYFDMTCQLLAKAPIDCTCVLLRVWDGTKCPYTLLKVIVEPNVTDGPSSFSAEKEELIANVLIYDNHVESAKQLKPGDFLRIYNLRAIPGSSKVPGLTSSQAVQVDHMAFHLHGGTAFGRGIRVLPEDSPDVQELKSVIAAFQESQELSDSEMMEVWGTPPEFMNPVPVPAETCTERRCSHDVQTVSLSELKRSEGRFHHVRVQLRSYEPCRLYQALKLFCSKQEVPHDEMVAAVFSEASRDSGPCSLPPWALSGRVNIPGDLSNRALSVYLSQQLLSEGKSKELMFLRGSTLEETRCLAAAYQNIVPVRSSEGQLAVLDLSVPFLFRGRRQYYGCARCSEAAVREPCAVGEEQIDEKVIAKALGIRLMQYVLLMVFELQDDTDTLDVVLFKDADLFFSVSAEEAAVSQEAQSSIRQTMDFICPPGGSAGDGPWLDLCLSVHKVKDCRGQSLQRYMICQTTFSKPPSSHPNPNPA